MLESISLGKKLNPFVLTLQKTPLFKILTFIHLFSQVPTTADALITNYSIKEHHMHNAWDRLIKMEKTGFCSSFN